MDKYEQHLKTEQELHKFVRLLTFLFCRRCYDRGCIIPPKGRHNNGQIYDELAKFPLVLNNLLDGFISAFFATREMNHEAIKQARPKQKSDASFEKFLVEHLAKGKIEEPAFFREKIRPVLVELFAGRYDIWIRHGAEKIKRTGKLHFQKTEKFPDITIVDYIAVETGRLFSYNQNPCIFDHSRRFQPQAFVRLKKLKKRGIKLLPVYHKRDAGKTELLNEGRDHLCMSDNLPWDDWIFLYDIAMIVTKCDNPKEVISETVGISINLALEILQITDKIIQTTKLLS